MTLGLGRTKGVALSGVDGSVVDVEAHISQGLPHFVVTGLPDKACAQAPDRVRSAAAISGCPVPAQRITVNLSPASILKHGTGFDLAIAMAVLSAAGTVRASLSAEVLHVGELSLDGRIRGVRGVLPAVLAASRVGIQHVVVPLENVAEARLVDGVTVHGPPTLAALIQWYAAAAGGVPLPEASVPVEAAAPETSSPDLADVVGQEQARLALELAASGGHHLLLTGPPGVGKTMLAERLVTILPALTRAEALETHAIRSLVGGMRQLARLDVTPPFVAPHHSASVASIVGGGSSVILPGAISRAHGGVLFLDEAPEFKGSVLQTLRQPLESGEVVIARAREIVRYPARFLLVLASNPCPCGKAWGKGVDCVCPPMVRRNYGARLGGPLLDRVDLQVAVEPIHREAFGDQPSEASAVVAGRVLAAREVQRARWRDAGWSTNGTVPGHVLRRPPYRLAGSRTAVLDRALDVGRLTLRGYDRTLRVAWTIADLGGRSVPSVDDVGLALSLRAQDAVAA